MSLLSFVVALSCVHYSFEHRLHTADNNRFYNEDYDQGITTECPNDTILMQLKQSRFFWQREGLLLLHLRVEKTVRMSVWARFASQCLISAHGKEVGAPSA